MNNRKFKVAAFGNFRMPRLCVCVKFSDFLVSENKMSRKNHVDKVDNVKNPAPAYEKEHKEYYDVKYALRSEHNRKPYKTFYNPTDNGYQ